MTKRVKRATWSQRVAEWRASGLTSVRFCEGREFTPGGLRHWAHRLGQTAQRKHLSGKVRIARVVAMPEGSPKDMSESRQSTPTTGDAGVVVEVGAARVAVRPGFDQATLTAVLEVLGRVGASR